MTRTKQLLKTVAGVRTLQEQEKILACVAHTIALQPFAETPVFFASSARSLVEVDTLAVFEQNYTCNVARDITDIFAIGLIYALIVNTSNTAIRLAKYPRVALANAPSVEIMHIKNDEYSSYTTPRIPVKFLNIVHYKPTADRLQQMRQYAAVQTT